MVTKPISSVKKFYFLEYFYVLLKSIDKDSNRENVFGIFKILKQERRLGESKYKKLTADSETPTKVQLDRYRYTFEQVIDEASEYNLVESDKGSLTLTEAGRRLISVYEIDGALDFNLKLFQLMENKYGAFRHIIDFLYRVNKYKPGLLILPNYSPRQLHFDKSNIRTTADIIEYSKALVTHLQEDIHENLGISKNLAEVNSALIYRLIENKLLSPEPNAPFSQENYNAITKRFRDFWTNHFLREIYQYEYSLNSFDIWVYRGKQIGIIQASEFYPNFNGRIVYPTAILAKSTSSIDFESLYNYDDGTKLFMHKPVGEENQNVFVDYLVKAYFDLRRSNHLYFISLAALRELVCYNMKISEHLFEDFLNKIYRLNLSGTLKIRISLEVDKLPEETKAMYLKQAPVMVDGKYRNIIAIDVTKGDKKYE